MKIQKLQSRILEIISMYSFPTGIYHDLWQLHNWKRLNQTKDHHIMNLAIPTVSINSPQKIFLQPHGIKTFINFIIWCEKLLSISWEPTTNKLVKTLYKMKSNHTHWIIIFRKETYNSLILVSYCFASNCDPSGATPAMTAERKPFVTLTFHNTQKNTILKTHRIQSYK